MKIFLWTSRWPPGNSRCHAVYAGPAIDSGSFGLSAAALAVRPIPRAVNMGVLCQITPEWQPLFQECGLGDFAALMHAPGGEQIGRQNGGRELRRLTLSRGEAVFRGYLKRLGREPWRVSLRMAFYGYRPRSGPLREFLLVQRLRAAGFAVMEPVAWGERRCCGLPREGFLVVREVPGSDVATLFETLSGQARRRLMVEVGRLVGRLHGQGFFQPVRFKDLIRTPCADGSRLVLIDRETSKPWPARFSRGRCFTALTRACRRILRDGHHWTAGSASAFFQGYAAALAAQSGMSTREWSRRTMRRLRQELAAEGQG
jgi:hypothetical protein